MEVGHFDYSVQAGEADRRARADQRRGGPAQLRSSRSTTASCPTSACTIGRTDPSPTPPTCCRVARSRRRGERRRKRWRRVARTCIWMTGKMADVGVDGINYDTTASTGDGEFLATLEAVEWAAKHTDVSIEVGMAAECVLGFHGQIDVRRRAARRDVAASAAQGGREGRGPHLRPGGQHQHASQHPLEPRPRGDVRQGRHRRSAVSRSTPMSAWASAACRCSRLPPADVVTRCSAAMIMIGKADGL